MSVRVAGRPRRSSRGGWDSGPRDFFILQRAFEAEAYALAPRMAAPAPQIATSLLRKGTPLISWEALPLDWPLFQQWLHEILATFSRCLPRLNKQGKCPPSIPGVELFKEAVRATYLGRALPRSIDGSRTGRGVFRSAVQLALRLFLCPQRDHLAPLVSDGLWMRPVCPLCGGLPDMALVDHETEVRWLVCCRCDTRWQFKTDGCPYCGCTDPASLSYFTTDRERCRRYLCLGCSSCCCIEPAYQAAPDSRELHCRLCLCDECRHYLRTVDLRQPEGRWPLYLLRWQTFKLDRQAHPRGYRSPTGMSSLFDLAVRTGHAAGGRILLRRAAHRLGDVSSLPGAVR